MCLSPPPPAAAMPPVTWLVVLLSPLARAAIVANPPTLEDRLDQLYEKLEKFAPSHSKHTIIPEHIDKLYEKLDSLSSERPVEKLYEKLDRLNALTPDKFAVDDEEMVDAMQEWGVLDEHIGAVVRDLRRLSEPEEYGDWNEDEDLQELSEDDYAMDGSEDLEPEDEEAAAQTPKPQKGAVDSIAATTQRAGVPSDADGGASWQKVAPSALERGATELLSAVDAIAATNQRPRILSDAGLSRAERGLLRREAVRNMAAVVQHSRCLTPQPRWLSVRQLAPAADTLYVPPCVMLHRCAPDSGCCYDEAEVCAPVQGQFITVSLFLNKVDGTLQQARMQFFNHTRCECVSRETLQASRPRAPRRDTPSLTQRIRVDSNLESAGNARRSDWPTQEPRVESDTTAPPQLRRLENVPELEAAGSAGNARQSDWPTQEPMLDANATDSPHLGCTCPTLFLARTTDGCACVCAWADAARRRDCLSLARGREHFGLRDRVCVARGACSPPACEHGAYERARGRCPLRRYRRRLSRRLVDKNAANVL